MPGKRVVILNFKFQISNSIAKAEDFPKDTGRDPASREGKQTSGKNTGVFSESPVIPAGMPFGRDALRRSP